VTSKEVIFQRLLERGFYPRELPPTFRTVNFGSILSSKPQYLNPQKEFSGETIFLDGATFQGNHRTFGVINPINYALLAEFLASNWPEIEKVMDISQYSSFKIVFLDKVGIGGRAFVRSPFKGKLAKQAHLSSAYPYVVHLDINRFYGSIYSHSIPWAVLGKAEAVKRHEDKTLDEHWSAKLDRLVRACKRNQTIGIPIGPDTSRVVSEIILSRVDYEFRSNGKKLRKRQVFHNIDDYEIGVESIAEAERTIARFEKEIRKFELRSHDGKTRVVSGELPENLRWEHKFNLLKKLDDTDFLDGFFSLLAIECQSHPGSNVIGYGLTRFAKRIAACLDKELSLRHLQTLLYSSPRYVSWVAPLFIGLIGGNDLSESQKRMLGWGLEECSRRHDIVSLLWFLYIHIHFDLKISASHKKLCFDVESVLVDLVLAHADHNDLIRGGFVEAQERYVNSSLSSSAWLYLYETEVRGWKAAVSEKKIGQPEDHKKFYKLMKENAVHFYDVSAFGVSEFTWNLVEEDFHRDQADSWPGINDLDADADGDVGEGGVFY
jgi:hypothetical protein